MKKILSIITAIMMTMTLLVGCGSDSASDTAKTDADKGNTGKDKAEIYVMIKAKGDLSYWDILAEGGERAAEDFADRANVHVIETTIDQEANLSAMYEAAENGADLICQQEILLTI